MALDQSALSELLDALRAGGDLDVVGEALALVLQALIEAEAAQQIGAGRCERSAVRTTHRNGSRARLLSTRPATSSFGFPNSARVVLPVAAGTTPTDRPGAAGGRDGGLGARHLDPQGR
jgi:hypothetical protein